MVHEETKDAIRKHLEQLRGATKPMDVLAIANLYHPESDEQLKQLEVFICEEGRKIGVPLAGCC